MDPFISKHQIFRILVPEWNILEIMSYQTLSVAK